MEFIAFVMWAPQPFFMWQQALDIFLNQFEPALTLEDSTDQWTTTQIYDMLRQHSGQELSVEELTQLLTAKGFRYFYTAELTLDWGFKRKK